jgi:hypothetical protein
MLAFFGGWLLRNGPEHIPVLITHLCVLIEYFLFLGLLLQLALHNPTQMKVQQLLVR